jgi:hypothetical protein
VESQKYWNVSCGDSWEIPPDRNNGIHPWIPARYRNLKIMESRHRIQWHENCIFLWHDYCMGEMCGTEIAVARFVPEESRNRVVLLKYWNGRGSHLPLHWNILDYTGTTIISMECVMISIPVIPRSNLIVYLMYYGIQ